MAEGKSDINLSLPFTLDNPSQSTHRASWSSSFIHNKSKPVEPSFEEFDLNAIASANNNDISITQPHIIQLKRPSSLRNYQNYTGNTIFFCHGRFLTSRSFWAFLLSLFLLIAPSILFLVFTCPWLWFHMSPSIPIVFSYLFLLTIAAMLKTSWTDPGILPRNLDRIEGLHLMEDAYGYPYTSMSDQSIPAPKQVLIKGVVVRLKYCETCCIYRPPRASHCRQCDNCVENEDHHCIWLNNCIGKRNYRTFFTFVILSTVLCFYAIAFSLSHIILLYQQSAITFLQALSIAPCSFFIVIFCFLLVIPIACLACYHCFLLYEGITTHEQLRWDKMMALSEKNLYSYGNPILNIIRALCRSHNKSYLARRKYADEIYDVTIPDNPTTTTNDNRPTNNIPEISIIHSN